MILELIKKEYKEQNSASSISHKVLFTLLKLILIGLLIALECFIFVTLDKKIEKYSSYGTFDFLVLFSFALMIFIIFSSLIKARKVLFNKNDSIVSNHLPISSDTIIVSKFVYLYLKESVLMFLVLSPLLYSYGASRNMAPHFYIYSTFMPFLMTFFALGVTLLFTPLYEFIYRLLIGKDLVQFILSSILMIGLCFLYKMVLDLFLLALNDSSIGGVFDQDFINNLHHATLYFIPVYNFLIILIGGINVTPNILIFLGATLISLILGIGISSFFYNKLSKQDLIFEGKNKQKIKEPKITKGYKSLFKKEFSLIFRDSSYTFSYTSLLIMIPFLSFVVISSLNAIVYNSLKMFLVYYPILINALNSTLILLFISVVTSSASLSISKEGKSLQIMKYLPISPLKMLLVKLSIPFILSNACLFMTLLILLISGNIDVSTFFITLFLGIIFIIFSLFIGLEIDMKDHKASKFKFKFVNDIIALALPLLTLGVALICSLYHLETTWIYLIEALLALCLLPLCFVKLKSRYERAFYEMEVN